MKRLVYLIAFAGLSILMGCEKEPESQPETEEREEDNTGILVDARDDREYKIVRIGTQWWMAENLAYLPTVFSAKDQSEDEPRYYVYDYSGTNIEEAKASENYETYGVLYNMAAAGCSCPSGWHLPSDDDWKKLERALGMSKSSADSMGCWRGTNEGDMLKATFGWMEDGNGSDIYGFAALPGGYHGNVGLFLMIENRGYWWTATSTSVATYVRILSYHHSQIYRTGSSPESGLTVRCVLTQYN